MQAELVRYVDSWGQKRLGFKKNCKICNKEFVAKKNSGRIYCSKQCFCKNRTLSNTTLIKCSFCGKEKLKTNSKIANGKHKIYFCSRKCKDTGQRIENGIKGIWPSHYSEHNNFQETKRFAQKDGKCEDCGLCKLYLICIHHKDGDRTNNNKENLEILCYNCHAKRHMELKDGVWVVNWHSLTPRELLKDL